MARVLVTGSTQGLGRDAAVALLAGGHAVVVHARHRRRVAELDGLRAAGAEVVIGDLARADETRALAEQVNALRPLDAIIHNAGVYAEGQRWATPEGHARTLAVNVLAPYILTALVDRPARLVYISSGMHRQGDSSLQDIDWTARRWNGIQAYCDSKLFVAALAGAVARRWPDVRSHVVDPGWVPTRMGGPAAPDDRGLGSVTQVWLAVSDDPETVRPGGYWFHQRPEAPAPAVVDPGFQDDLLAELARLTGINPT